MGLGQISWEIQICFREETQVQIYTLQSAKPHPAMPQEVPKESNLQIKQ